jgi:hypothetical protein
MAGIPKHQGLLLPHLQYIACWMVAVAVVRHWRCGTPGLRLQAPMKREEDCTYLRIIINEQPANSWTVSQLDCRISPFVDCRRQARATGEAFARQPTRCVVSRMPSSSREFSSPKSTTASRHVCCNKYVVVGACVQVGLHHQSDARAISQSSRHPLWQHRRVSGVCRDAAGAKQAGVGETADFRLLPIAGTGPLNPKRPKNMMPFREIFATPSGT